jgi:oligoendopeptidase F
MSERKFLPRELVIHNWDDLKPYYEALISREVNSLDHFRLLLEHTSELESVVAEDLAWRYIRMTCDTTDKAAESTYLDFVQHIQPHIAPAEDALNKKIVACPEAALLEGEDEAYRIYFRSLRNAVELFREENVPLQAELQTLAQHYASIQGALSIQWEGKEITMEQAAIFLQDPNRKIREEVWTLLHERRMQDVAQLDALFTEMVQKRHQVALNAGFRNFRDYMFRALARFDYTPEDCFEFHEAIATIVVPMLRKQYQHRMNLLDVDELRPWDLAVDPEQKPALRPFRDGAELLDRSIRCLQDTDPFFGECLEEMKRLKLLDLESRKGKAPGGYNYPLAERNVPFIFMNASGKMRDVETLVHEAGHAVHSFLSSSLRLHAFKNTPSEVAELASMSMELLTMEHWDVFFEQQADHVRAMREQLEGIIQTLPWIGIVDKFQHWVYEHPNHSHDERKEAWVRINREFGTGLVDYSSYEDALAWGWHRQLHIFEVPFYYIEYGMAQLGAIGIWKQVMEHRSEGIQSYKEALKLGYTRSIPEIYQTGGIRFGFSEVYVRSLFQFVDQEIRKLPQ